MKKELRKGVKWRRRGAEGFSIPQIATLVKARESKKARKLGIREILMNTQTLIWMGMMCVGQILDVLYTG